MTIIIVSWNVQEKLRKNLLSINQANAEIIVIDNHSKDDTVKMIKAEFPHVKLIENQINLGFAKACNQGIKLATNNLILLLNPDMELFPNTLDNLKQAAITNPDAIVIGGQLLTPDHQVIKSVRRFPKLFDQLAIVLKLPHLFPNIIKHYLQTDFNYQQTQAVDSVRGSFFLINKSAYQKLMLKDPYLDERYFIWFEEVDFCKDIVAHGGKIIYTPQAKAIDHIGQSFKQINTNQKQLYFRNSMLHYFNKWEGKIPAMIIKLAWAPIMVLIKKTPSV